MKTYSSSFTSPHVGYNDGWIVKTLYNSSSELWFGSVDSNITLAGSAIGCVVSVDGISTSIDIHKSSWQHSRFVVTLTDGNVSGSASSSLSDKTLSGLLVQKQFKGRKITVWRIHSGMSTISGHEPEMVGYVTDVYTSVDGATIQFTCDGWPEKYRKLIPTSVVSEEDYPLAPKESFGLPIPSVYGAFTHEADGGSERDMLINNFHYVPSVCVDASSGKFLFASHAIHELNDTDIAIFERGLGNYLCGVYAFDGAVKRPGVSIAAPANATLSSIANLLYWSADSIYQIPTIKGSHDSNETTNRQYLFNQSLYDGASVLTTTAIDKYMLQRFASISGDIELPNVAASTDIVLWVNVSATTGSPTYKLCIYTPILANESRSAVLSTSSGWYSYNIGNFSHRSENDPSITIASTDQWTLEELSRYEYGIKCETSSDSVSMRAFCVEIKNPVISSLPNIMVVTHDVRDYNRGRSVPGNVGDFGIYQPHNYYQQYYISSADLYAYRSVIARSAVYAELKGREFGSWIDDVSRSNTSNAGDVIYESNFQIESILRDELGFGDDEINVDDFDNAESGRHNTRFSINKQVDAYDLISELSSNTTSLTFPVSGGKWRHKEIPTDPNGDALFDATFDWSEISIKEFFWSPLDQICNKLKVRYHFDYGKLQYMKEYSLEDTGSQGTGVNGYNHTFEREIVYPYFRFDSSSGATNWAEEAAQTYLSIWKREHGMISFDMLNREKFAIEEGDIVKFSNFERNIGSIGAGSTGNYWSSLYTPASNYWMILSRTPYTDKVSYVAFNLHQLV